VPHYCAKVTTIVSRVLNLESASATTGVQRSSDKSYGCFAFQVAFFAISRENA
jgi:hypothetical protein